MCHPDERGVAVQDTVAVAMAVHCGMWRCVAAQLRQMRERILLRIEAQLSAVSRDNIPPPRLARAWLLMPKMPVPTATATAVLARRREAQNVPPNLTEEQGLAQLQRAVDPEDHALVGHAHHADHSRGSSASSGRNVQGPVPAPAPAPAPSITDGAGNPIVAGADYSSLRLLTRRQPRDPESVLQGLDTSSMDLSWTARESPTTLDPNGQPWRYPKKRGKSEGSNLDQFKDEITERTKNGQGCKAIAEAFIAMGVDTSVRAVARQRMKWGLRQRVRRIDALPGHWQRAVFLTNPLVLGQEKDDRAGHCKHPEGPS